jgi:hypothetical protein
MTGYDTYLSRCHSPSYLRPWDEQEGAPAIAERAGRSDGTQALARLIDGACGNQ